METAETTALNRLAPDTIPHNYRRTYDPAMGRYQQSDPIALASGLNT